MPTLLKSAASPLFRRFFTMDADSHPPETPEQMAHFMGHWRLLVDNDQSNAARFLATYLARIELTRDDALPAPASHNSVRLPAQWERMETIILAWPSLYPALWELHAAMVTAILPVCGVTILVQTPMWANAVRLYLEQHNVTDFSRIRFLNLPTDDIWVRDYGPFVGLDASGQQVAVHATYDPLSTYPQTRDNSMPARWAAHNEIPMHELDLHTEGGNYWSDGTGTLIMSDETFIRHQTLSYDEVEHRLRSAFSFDKLIVTPHLLQEETGHVDLLVKLASAQTVLVSQAAPSINAENLRRTRDIFQSATNARGERYQVIELPSLPRYHNWGMFSIWRSYTNSLTVNGRVLVPIYGELTDEIALKAYERAMPYHEIIPINCKWGINGGGAVHCMTKEVPSAQ
jgi:agmatine deiminase